MLMRRKSQLPGVVHPGAGGGETVVEDQITAGMQACAEDVLPRRPLIASC